MSEVIRIEDITKVYKMGDIEVRALDGVSLRINKGEFVCIMGASGSGKSTMMNIVGCLDKPSSGRYFLDSHDVSLLDDNSLADIRNKKVGFVFQTFNLLPRMSALKNVELPLVYSGIPEKKRKLLAKSALEKMGLGDRLNHKPNELSGGQRQRVAIARALVTDPAIILADEPTGNLDSRTGLSIMAIFQKLHREGATIVMVTHELDIAMHAQRIVYLKDGKIQGDESVKNPLDAAKELEGAFDLDTEELKGAMEKHIKERL